MSKELQRKIKSSKLVFENEKENTSGSQLQSLLVSSIRYDSQAPFNESQGYELKSKNQPNQSLIKKQVFSNVYIEESPQIKCQNCQKKMDSLNENIVLINLKLQQLQSKLNLCFSKYGKVQSKMSQLQLSKQQLKHFQAQSQQKMKYISSNMIKTEQQNRFRQKQRNQEINRIKKSLNRLQNKQGDKMCIQSKMIQHKFQKFKDQQEYKMKQVIETLQKIGNLQRKMIQRNDKSEQSTFFLEEGQVKKKYFKTYSISDKNRTNESTNISYSRNCQFPK